MSQTSSIEWTDATWNPTRGCSIVGPECTNCYAMKQAHRHSGPGGSYEGLTRLTKHGVVWTGDVRVIFDKLFDPLRWRGRKLVFVNSMSDLFHEKVGIADIAYVFAVMGLAHWHTFQLLTKRADRQRELLNSDEFWELVDTSTSMIMEDEDSPVGPGRGWDALDRRRDDVRATTPIFADTKMLPNAWIGVSVGHPDYLHRLDDLLATPAAVRWVSAEPLLDALDLRPWLKRRFVECPDETHDEETDECAGCPGDPELTTDYCGAKWSPRLDWVVVGGESGNKARAFSFGWAERIQADCGAAGVPFFFKQAGARTATVDGFVRFKKKESSDLSRIPERLRVREYPTP